LRTIIFALSLGVAGSFAIEFLGTENLNSDNFMAGGLHSIEERLQRYGDFKAMSSLDCEKAIGYPQYEKHAPLE
jgi:hypothetical protein